MITPDEKHFLKAAAWDALYASLQVHELAGPEGEHGMAGRLMGSMDKILENTGARLASSKTWEEMNMPRRFDHDELYRCEACGHATSKGRWIPIHDIGKEKATFWVCPWCGSLVDVRVPNVTEDEPEPTQEPDGPKETSPPSKGKKG